MVEPSGAANRTSVEVTSTCEAGALVEICGTFCNAAPAAYWTRVLLVRVPG